MNPFRILNLLAEGVAEKARVDAFGPDYRRRRAAMDMENAVKGAGLRESQRAEAAELAARMRQYPGLSPDEAVSQGRADDMLETGRLKKRLAEAQVGSQEATAEYTRARPGIEGEKLDERRQHDELMRELGLARIDAAAARAGNRPEPGGYIAVTLKDGTPAMFNAKTGRTVPLPEGAMPKPAAAEKTAMDEGAVMLKTLGDVRRDYKPEYVGPLAGRAYAAATSVPGLGKLLGTFNKNLRPNEARSRFVAEVAALQNRTIKALTGAQMSEYEVPRLSKETPIDTDPPEVFQAKVQALEPRLQLLQMVKEGRITRDEAIRRINSDDPLGVQNAGPAPGGSRFRILSVQ